MTAVARGIPVAGELEVRRKQRLRQRLERLVATYGSACLHTDPVCVPHRYKAKRDIEVAAFLTSCIAYGNAKQIIASANGLLERTGCGPCRFVLAFDPARDQRQLEGFKHRLVTAKDLGCLLSLLRQVLVRHKSLERLFASYWRGDLRAALAGFVEELRSGDTQPLYPSFPQHGGLAHMIPSPRSGHACKRLNLFLRWMVRRDDIDFGLWRCPPPSALLVPVDTHVARIAFHLGFTRRRTADWKMAEEITARLRELDPEDPVKYDFALSRLGILGDCPRHRDPEKCRHCGLVGVCQLPPLCTKGASGVIMDSTLGEGRAAARPGTTQMQRPRLIPVRTHGS